MLDINMFVGLCFACPFGDEHCECAMREKRKLPIEDRLAWADSLSDSEKINILSYHELCLYRREKGDA